MFYLGSTGLLALRKTARKKTARRRTTDMQEETALRNTTQEKVAL